VQDIFEAVDGVGVKPSIPTIEERKKVKAAKPKVEGAKPPANATPVEDSTDQLAEVEKFINQELSPGEQEIADRVGQEGAEPEQDPATRGEKRFQELANARRDAEERAGRAEAYTQQLTQHLQGFQQQVSQAFQEMQVTNARLSAQVEMLSRGTQPQEEVDPEVRVMDRLSNAALEKLAPQVRKYIEPVMQELQTLKQEKAEAAALARSTENKNRYLSDADTHTVNTVLRGIPEEYITPQHREDYKSDVLSTMYAYRTDAPNAAKIVREKNLRNALLFIKAFGKSKQGAREAGAAAPPVPGRGVSATSAGAQNQQVPSLQLLAKHGFTGDQAALDWAFAGSPPLS